MGRTESKSAIDASLLLCLFWKKFPEDLRLADVSFNSENKVKRLAENCTLMLYQLCLRHWNGRWKCKRVIKSPVPADIKTICILYALER